MTIQDLVEVIESAYCNNNAKECIEELNDLLGMMLNNPNRFITDFSIAIEEYAEEKNICPFCGSELEIVDSYLEDHEYFGTPCSKQVNTYGCSDNCGFITD